MNTHKVWNYTDNLFYNMCNKESWRDASLITFFDLITQFKVKSDEIRIFSKEDSLVLEINSSNDLKDWYNNLCFFPSKKGNHRGWERRSKIIYESIKFILDDLISKNTYNSLVVMAHSRGSNLSLEMVDKITNDFSKEQIEQVFFLGVGHAASMTEDNYSHILNKCTNHLIINNASDIISNIPSNIMGYRIPKDVHVITYGKKKWYDIFLVRPIHSHFRPTYFKHYKNNDYSLKDRISKHIFDKERIND